MKPIIQKDPNEESLIIYPCEFPIKVMGINQEGFLEAIGLLVQEHVADFNPTTIEERPSKAGNYLALAVNITATSREQLDNLYLALTAHPMVKVVL